MKKRAKICFYIFITCAFFALGILGYFILSTKTDNVMVGSKKFVTFNEVPNASVYTLSVRAQDKEDLKDYKAYYKISKTKIENNQIEFKTEVRIDNKKVAEESYIQEIISEKNEKIDCIIKNYKVTFFDENDNESETLTFEDQTLRNINKQSLFCVVSEYFENVFVEDGIYHIVCNALDENGNVLENSNYEFDYNYEAYYLRDFARRPSFFMNGFEIDYVIDDTQEFKEFVWHSILYRENDITFYCNTPDITENNVNRLTVEAINDYPEYDGLYETGTYAELNNSVGKLKNFYYYLDFTFTKNYKDLEKADKNSYDKAIKELYSKNDKFNVKYASNDEVSTRAFPIDSLEKEVLVYNTEQLFMAVQYGAKPIFLDENDSEYKEEYSVVETVYNNAKSELEKINTSDSLSDYAKALNIYRYLCQNVVYDYVTYNYMEIKDDFSVFTFGSFSCFYLEGVFFDLNNQYAVCDGIAKAYTLMCRIEGIPSVKVNGVVNGYNHAWNKVGLEDEDPETNEKEIKWLYVDATWGVGKNEEEKKEYATHSYYMFKNTDKLNGETRRVEYASEIDVSNGSLDNKNPIEVNFDYYKNIYYKFENENNEEKQGNLFVGDEDFSEVESIEEVSEIINKEFETILDFVKYKLNQKKENGEEVNYAIEIEFNNILIFNNKIYQISIDKYNELITQKIINNKEWLNSFGFDNIVNMEWYKVSTAKNILLFRFYESVEETDAVI